MSAEPLRVAFFGHDALESTVVKRAALLAERGCAVTGFMFRRERPGLGARLACPVVDLGTTRDRSYAARLPRLAVGLARALRAGPALREAEVIYARNVDMLALASLARRLARARAPVVYEVLDVQRPFTQAGPGGAALRAAERVLLRGVSLLVVSSPAFVERYFAPVQGRADRWFLLENKLAAAPPCPPPERPAGPPWVVGWFGTLRCRNSLDALRGLADALGDCVAVRLGGRPSPRDIGLDEIESVVGARPNMDYIGAYASPDDLARVYGPVHFSWCVDRTDAGTNSDWLLPNRLYEGGLHGAVALAGAGTATGARVESLGLGVALGEPLGPELHGLLAGMTPGRYAELARAVRDAPRDSFVGAADADALVAELRRLAGRPVQARPDGPARVCVVIPFFQREAGILARALRSVAAQALGDGVSVAVVVVDDGSPQAPGPDVLAGGAGLAVRVVRRPNGGPGAARNTGLEAVPPGTDFVAFLDSDDAWAPGHLRTAIDALGAENDLFFCDNQPFELAHSYFAEIGIQTRGAIDLGALPGAAPTGPGPALAIEAARALPYMTRLYLAHTSTLVLRRAALGHVRFDRSLRVAGEDYLFVLAAASQARQVCYALANNVARGRGFNLYMGAVGWGQPGNLDLILDNLLCFKKARGLRLGPGARGGVEARVRSYRTEFLYAWLRLAAQTRRPDLAALGRAFRSDPGLPVAAPRLLAAALLRKARGGRAVDHFASVAALASGPAPR